MRKWLAVDAYEMKLDEKLGNIPPSQYADGSRLDLIDTTTITMQWVMGFERAKIAYDQLLSVRLFKGHGLDSPRSRKALMVLLSRAGLFTHYPEAFGDLRQPPIWQHEHWQFQLSKIDGGDIDKVTRRLVGLDDLYGALAVFSLNLAAYGMVIPKTNVSDSGMSCVQHYTIEVTHVGVYVRDTYDFLEDQYLGHWSKQGIEVVSSFAAPDLAPWLGLPKPTLQDYEKPSGDPSNRNLAVGNVSFQEYRRKHNKGGDLLVFSDMVVAKLKRPFRFKVTPNEVNRIGL